jgi:hypothetical protein
VQQLDDLAIRTLQYCPDEETRTAASQHIRRRLSVTHVVTVEGDAHGPVA